MPINVNPINFAGYPGVQSFISRMNSANGIAKSERYLVMITPPLGLAATLGSFTSQLIFQCEAAELPGVGLNVVDYRTYGPSRKLATQTMYNEMNLSFYCSNTFYEKPLFDGWIDYVNPRLLGWDFRYVNDYASSINIYQFDLEANVIYETQLIKAFPIAVHPLPLRWSDDSLHKLNVTFVYQRYIPQQTFMELSDAISAIPSTNSYYDNGPTAVGPATTTTYGNNPN